MTTPNYQQLEASQRFCAKQLELVLTIRAIADNILAQRAEEEAKPLPIKWAKAVKQWIFPVYCSDDTYYYHQRNDDELKTIIRNTKTSEAQLDIQMKELEADLLYAKSTWN